MLVPVAELVQELKDPGNAGYYQFSKETITYLEFGWLALCFRVTLTG